jgi:hypothetical protein
MVAPVKQVRSRKPAPAWHKLFLAMLPAVKTHAKIAFRHLDPEDREEVVQEVTCNARAASIPQRSYSRGISTLHASVGATPAPLRLAFGGRGRCDLRLANRLGFSKTVVFWHVAEQG